jgi:hypothetical protein
MLYITVGRQAIIKPVDCRAAGGEKEAEGRGSRQGQGGGCCGRRKGQGGRGRHVVRNGGIRKRAGRF